MNKSEKLIRIIEGDWVQDAKDSGWWDNLKALKGYLEDIERDYHLFKYFSREGFKYPPSYAEELKNDIKTVRNRIKELGLK